jgi:hypothetical protein
MEHPLIGDISQLSLEDLSTKLAELNRKLTIAQRTGNAHVCNQLRMAIESFQTRYQVKLKETQKNGSAEVNFDHMINIE